MKIGDIVGPDDPFWKQLPSGCGAFTRNAVTRKLGNAFVSVPGRKGAFEFQRLQDGRWLCVYVGLDIMGDEGPYSRVADWQLLQRRLAPVLRKLSVKGSDVGNA